MQAFPEGSANMALGGGGPLNSRIDLDRFHGRGDEGFQDYAAARKQEPVYFNPKDRTEPIHGVESYGLGTSTFLEGAPASRKALERRESEDQAAMFASGGLQRKKSLAHRLRGMSNTRPRPSDFRSPEARYRHSGPDTSPPVYKQTPSAGGAQQAYAMDKEVNPFDSEYNAAFDKKGIPHVRIADKPERPTQAGAARSFAPASPPKNSHLVRSITSDGHPRPPPAMMGGGEDDHARMPSALGAGSGLLNRMRSLKGGPRKPRPAERKNSTSGRA